MNLEARPRIGASTEIVDVDRDGGEGRPLIVARTYEDDVKRLLLAAPLMRDLCVKLERLLADLDMVDIDTYNLILNKCPNLALAASLAVAATAKPKGQQP